MDPISPQRRAFADRTVRTRLEPPSPADVGVCPVFCIQTPLPHRELYDDHRPSPDGIRPLAAAYQRRNGEAVLTVHAALAPDAEGRPRSRGIPYGGLARLLILHFATTAARSRSRTVPLGDSLASFLRALHLASSGGRGGRIPYLRDQLLRLTGCTLTVERCRSLSDRTRLSGRHVPPTASYRLWWDRTSPDVGGEVVLGEGFYREVTERAFPLDLRKVHALRASPLAVDLYAWLTYSAGRLAMTGRSEKSVSWRALHPQLGGGYADSPTGYKEFARAARGALQRVRVLWPTLHVETPPGRLVLHTRRPDIPFRSSAPRS